MRNPPVEDSMLVMENLISNKAQALFLYRENLSVIYKKKLYSYNYKPIFNLTATA